MLVMIIINHFQLVRANAISIVTRIMSPSYRFVVCLGVDVNICITIQIFNIYQNSNYIALISLEQFYGWGKKSTIAWGALVGRPGEAPPASHKA